MVRRSSATSRGTAYWFYYFSFLMFEHFVFRTQVFLIYSRKKNVAKGIARTQVQRGTGLTVEDTLGTKLREAQFYQRIISLSYTFFVCKFSS